MGDNKLTFGDFKGAEKAIKKLSTTSFGTDIKAAYWVGRLVKKFNSVSKDIETSRQTLIKELAVTDDKGTSIPPENRVKWEKGIEDILAIEVELGLPLLTLTVVERMNPTPEDLIALEKFTVDIEQAIKDRETVK